MDSKYPVKPYKPAKTATTTTTAKMTGKKGKQIVAVYKDAEPDVVVFSIKSNRGTVKDVIEMPIQEAIDFFRTLSVMHEHYLKEKEDKL